MPDDTIIKDLREAVDRLEHKLTDLTNRNRELEAENLDLRTVLIQGGCPIPPKPGAKDD